MKTKNNEMYFSAKIHLIRVKKIWANLLSYKDKETDIELNDPRPRWFTYLLMPKSMFWMGVCCEFNWVQFRPIFEFTVRKPLLACSVYRVCNQERVTRIVFSTYAYQPNPSKVQTTITSEVECFVYNTHKHHHQRVNVSLNVYNKHTNVILYTMVHYQHHHCRQIKLLQRLNGLHTHQVYVWAHVFSLIKTLLWDAVREMFLHHTIIS